MEAAMIAGRYSLQRLGLGVNGPTIFKQVYKILQRPNPWLELSLIQVDSNSDGLPDVGEADGSHWWVTPEAEIIKDPYSEMAASFLASVEGVSSGQL
jgi:hypothetical protein